MPAIDASQPWRKRAKPWPVALTCLTLMACGEPSASPEARVDPCEQLAARSNDDLMPYRTFATAIGSTVAKSEYYEIEKRIEERSGRTVYLADDRTYVGSRVYHSFCYVCHEDTAQGGKIADNQFAQNLLSRMRFMDIALFRCRVMNGIRGMPPWADHPIVARRVDQLFAYLKALGNQHLTFREGQMPLRRMRP